MKRLVAVLLILAPLGGCKDYGKCLESHVMLMPMVQVIGKVTVVTLMPVTICDRYEYPEGRQ